MNRYLVYFGFALVASTLDVMVGHWIGIIGYVGAGYYLGATCK
jgi:hypothetical protein